MIERITENVFRIEVPLPGNPLKLLNSYYIKGEEGGRSLLIDTGFNMPECKASLEKGLTELKADLSKTDIYLTHLHSDHIGLAAELQRGDMRVYLSAEDTAMANFNSTSGRWSAYDALYSAEGFSQEELERLALENPARAYAPAKVAEFTPVQDGERLFYGGMELEVMLVPGHTPGNTILFCREKKLAFLGDHVLFNITPNITYWIGMDDPLGQYCVSLNKVHDLEIEIPLPGHRAVTCSTKERVEQILAHHEKRLEEAYQIISENPGLNCYQIAGKMTWNIRTKSGSWADFPLSQKWFAFGEAIAHMERLINAGKVERNVRPNGKRAYFAK